MRLAMWPTKYTSVATQTKARRMPTVSERWGVNAPSSCVRTLRSTISAYEKVPRKAPSVTCTPRSRVKLRSRRGPIWPAASDSAAIVIENTVPATPIVDDATAPSSVRAPVPPPL